MNEYGRMALDHWRQWRPLEFSMIEDPQEHFSILGQQAQLQIVELADQLAAPDPAGEAYLEKVGRLNNAKTRAQEIVLRELILVDPEPGQQELAVQLDEQSRQTEMTVQIAADQLEMDLEREQEVADLRAKGLLPPRQAR